ARHVCRIRRSGRCDARTRPHEPGRRTGKADRLAAEPASRRAGEPPSRRADRSTGTSSARLTPWPPHRAMVGYGRLGDMYAIYGVVVAVTPVPDQTSPAAARARPTGAATGPERPAGAAAPAAPAARARPAGPAQPLTEPSVRPPRQKRRSTRMRL